jgi:hypothetical protein
MSNNTNTQHAEPVGKVTYLHNAHLVRATEIALHTAAYNALSMAQWQLNSDVGSTRQALAKAQAAVEYLKLLAERG